MNKRKRYIFLFDATKININPVNVKMIVGYPAKFYCGASGYLNRYPPVGGKGPRRNMVRIVSIWSEKRTVNSRCKKDVERISVSMQSDKRRPGVL